MTRWIRLLFLVSAAASVGCLDPEPINPPYRDGATASAACLECMATVKGGCGAELAACRAAPTCSHGYDCTFANGCVGGSSRIFVSCLPNCSLDAGYGGADDPGRAPGLAIFTCMTHGACANRCFTDGLQDDAGIAGDASVDDGQGGSSDASVDGGGACTNPADLAIVNDADGGTINDASRACGLACFANADMTCNETCMQMKTGMSPTCAGCWGDSINCATQHCLVPCLAGSSDPACLTCNQQYCTPAFHACAGL